MTTFTLPQIKGFKEINGEPGLKDFKQMGIPIKRTAGGREDLFYYERFDAKFLEDNPNIPIRTRHASFRDSVTFERFDAEITFLLLDNTNYQIPSFEQYMSGASNTSEDYLIRVFFQIDEAKGTFRIKHLGKNYTAARMMATILDDMAGDNLFEKIEDNTLKENGIELNKDHTSMVNVFVQQPWGEIIDIEVEMCELLEHVTGFEVLDFTMHIDGENDD